MKCCSKEMIKEGNKWVCKTCGYILIPLFNDLTDKERFEVDWGCGCWKYVNSCVTK